MTRPTREKPSPAAEASRYLGVGMTWALSTALFLWLGTLADGRWDTEPIFTLLGADERTLPLIREYMEVYYFGGFLLILPLVGNFAIRAVGDARVPALILSISALVNIVLDPLDKELEAGINRRTLFTFAATATLRGPAWVGPPPRTTSRTFTAASRARRMRRLSASSTARPCNGEECWRRR